MGALLSWKQLYDYLLNYYTEGDFPALLHQARQWEKEQPLKGMKILDASPVFRNTIAKYMALTAAGADLEVCLAPGVIVGQGVPEILSDLGINTITQPVKESVYDIILDCAGIHRNLKPTLGYVELTKSGEGHYLNANLPVFLADGGRIKIIETTLGTGEGFIRALHSLGYRDLRGRHMVVFGYGKVGRGIVLYARHTGAKLTVIDFHENIKSRRSSGNVEFISWEDETKWQEKLRYSWCAVTATGIRNALQGRITADQLSSETLLANMGVEDEWGPDIPFSRVLNHKQPLNFLLPEPTRLRYIEATLALHNAGALELIRRKDKTQGIFLPPSQLEDSLLAITRTQGLIAQEMKWANL